MADVFDIATRSYIMSRIRGKDTKPEILVRKYLYAHGFRYRLHDKRLPGTPDIVLPKHKTVIFVHGCFWHGHEKCKYANIPKTRTKWWTEKFNRNKANDKKAINLLKKDNWKVITIFECQLKNAKLAKTLEKTVATLLGI